MTDDSITFGVFLWTDDGAGHGTEGNKLQLGHRDDPTSMPDEWEGWKLHPHGTAFGDFESTTHQIITHEDRYGDIGDLGPVEQGTYKKLGEITIGYDTEYRSYHDSPPSYEDTNGEILTSLKPTYYNWRALAV